jgi:succinoglycan biosynthesis protein ExoA
VVLTPRTNHPSHLVSIIVPMLNEAANVERLVGDIAAQDFAGELEVIVADGGSTDGSVERMQAAAERAGLSLVVLDNPARLVATGLNRCIEHSRGSLVVRLDCKARYPRDYVRRCATTSAETGAWNVGGRVIPTGQSAVERAFACAMDSPFGGISWARHNASRDRVEVDTVYCGAFRREALERVGAFDPDVADNHDEDFNLRLRDLGGRVVFDPGIRAYYTPASSFTALFGRYFKYGFFKVPLMLKHRQVVSARSLAPAALLGSIAVLLAAAERAPAARRLLAAELAVYGGAAFAFGVVTVARRREPWTLLPCVVAAFPTFHVGYGLGTLWGSLRAALRR